MIDQAQMQQQPATPTLTDVLTPMVAPLVQQATQQAVTDATTVIRQQVASLQQIADQHSAQIAAAVAPAVTSILTNVESDPATQRIVVCSVVGAALVGALIILIAYLTGNAQAGKVIAAAPALIAGAVLWISKAGVSLPSTPKQQ